MSRRSKEKYPNLQRKFTLPSRQHLVDQDYTEGVKDENGNMAIRAMTEEEKAWLDQFNSEYVNVDFYTMPEIKALEEASEIIAEQENPRKKDLKLYTYFLIIIEFIKDEFFLQDIWQRKQCGDMNNARNRDILNDALTRDLTLEIFEEYVEEEHGLYYEDNNSLF